MLRYLGDAYRALRQTVPDAVRTDELDDIIEWLGAVVRQTDSSLLDEWEALSDPATGSTAAAPGRAAARRPSGSPPTSAPSRVLVRNAMFRRVELAALQPLGSSWASSRPRPGRASPARTGATALEAYFAEHDSIDTGPDARGPQMLLVEKGDRHLGGAADHRRPGGRPRLAHHRDRRPRRLRRGGRAGPRRDGLRAALTSQSLRGTVREQPSVPGWISQVDRVVRHRPAGGLAGGSAWAGWSRSRAASRCARDHW